MSCRWEIHSGDGSNRADERVFALHALSQEEPFAGEGVGNGRRMERWRHGQLGRWGPEGAYDAPSSGIVQGRS